MTRGRTMLETENYANEDITKIERWTRDNKIKFNENKSKVLVVTRKRKRDNENVNIYINNKPIEQVEELKYLGIYLDRRFRFNKHIEHVHDKTIALIHTLSKSAKLSWGLGNKALITIYKGAVELTEHRCGMKLYAMQKMSKKMQRIQQLLNI